MHRHQSMQIGNFTVGLNLPAGVVSRHDAAGREIVNHLPPYAPAAVYDVADCQNVPLDWTRPDAQTRVYVAGVRNGQGMWLDLTRNTSLASVVAAIVDVQGINVLTALPVDPANRLEQYRHRCPVHNTEFGPARRCEACGFEWPAQNYLFSDDSHTMWIDGFRVRGANGNPTGEVRQFLFTEDPGRGVAAHILGDRRSFDIKIRFFNGPQRPQPTYRTRGGLEAMGATLESFGASNTKGLSKSMDVAAGALINQNYGVDNRNVSAYSPHVGTIVLYYVNEADLPNIMGRKADLLQSQGIPVGNPGGHSEHKTY